jgi:hypothetical protein
MSDLYLLKMNMLTMATLIPSQSTCRNDNTIIRSLSTYIPSFSPISEGATVIDQESRT